MLIRYPHISFENKIPCTSPASLHHGQHRNTLSLSLSVSLTHTHNLSPYLSHTQGLGLLPRSDSQQIRGQWHAKDTRMWIFTGWLMLRGWVNIKINRREIRSIQSSVQSKQDNSHFFPSHLLISYSYSLTSVFFIMNSFLTDIWWDAWLWDAGQEL